MSTSTARRHAPAIAGAPAGGRRDLVLVLLVSVAAAIVCDRFNVSEALLAWAQPRERFQLDELPAILLTVALGMVWFSVRRYREAARELVRRQQAEQELRVALADNRRLARQSVEVQEAERRALARDLHDELGQQLSAMKIDAVGMRAHLASRDPDGHQAAADIVRGLDQVQAVVLGLIRQLRPAGLDELGLAAALEQCVGEWRRRLPRTTVELSVSAPLDGLDEVRRVALYRLIQEGLTNIARHAHATHAAIRIGRERAPSGAAGEQIVAAIEDNGIGAEAARSSGGLGLIGMRERVEAVGGSLFMERPSSGGFRLRAAIPLGAAA
jgi:signal transduction histidine kinase